MDAEIPDQSLLLCAHRASAVSLVLGIGYSFAALRCCRILVPLGWIAGDILRGILLALITPHSLPIRGPAGRVPDNQ